jgi:hypothetical protein
MSNPYRRLLLTLWPVVGCEEAPPPTDEPEPYEELGCLGVPADAVSCPLDGSLNVSQILPNTCGATVLTIDGQGTFGSCPAAGGPDETIQWCVYPITVLPPDNVCDYGRPLTLADGPRTAAPTTRAGWTVDAPTPRPDPERAARWTAVALAEHASVASFGRFALELLALGAPADLVAAAHAAALDEVHHARLAFGLASQFGGQAVGPGPLALGDLRVGADLVALAVATAREGCVAETLSALQVAIARDHHDGPEREVLTTLADDEARHAALAWRTLRWALDVGGDEVRAAVAAALRDPPPWPASGLLPPDAARAACLRGWHEVICPAAAALLAGPAASADAAALGPAGSSRGGAAT